MIALEQLLDMAERHARRMLLEHKRDQLVPAFLYIADGHAAVIGAPWANNEDKRAYANAVRQILRTNDAKAYSFITEAWMATMPKDMPAEIAQTMRPSEQPNREECVIAFATDGFHTRWRVWAIKRDKRGRVRALPPKDDAGDMTEANMTSWLTNLLGGNA
jgi:hypothetical protein